MRQPPLLFCNCQANRAYVAFFEEHGLAGRLPARSTAMWGVPTTAKVAFSVVAAAGDAPIAA